MDAPDRLELIVALPWNKVASTDGGSSAKVSRSRGTWGCSTCAHGHFLPLDCRASSAGARKTLSRRCRVCEARVPLGSCGVARAHTALRLGKVRYKVNFSTHTHTPRGRSCARTSSA